MRVNGWHKMERNKSQTLIDNYFDRLPFLVKPENIAHYDNGLVSILDRRLYPFKREFVLCRTYEEFAQAITDMVTQSGGPGYVAAYGMVQAAHQYKNQSSNSQAVGLERASKVLGHARPTNNNIKYLTQHLLTLSKKALANGENVEEALLAEVVAIIQKNASISMRIGINAANELSDGDTILTHCWAENSIVSTLLAAQDQEKRITVFCSETRPYLQGARLTADAISELDIPTTVITDNMPGYVISQGKINVFFAGADRVTMSGHVINKIGTFQVALCCKYYNIPFFAFSHGPDPNSRTDKDVEIEERDPNETLYCLGVRTATTKVSGYYPAFDLTPPELITGIITDQGVFEPNRISEYLKCKTNTNLW